jgi:hypothetical protein
VEVEVKDDESLAVLDVLRWVVVGCGDGFGQNDEDLLAVLVVAFEDPWVAVVAVAMRRFSCSSLDFLVSVFATFYGVP